MLCYVEYLQKLSYYKSYYNIVEDVVRHLLGTILALLSIFLLFWHALFYNTKGIYSNI